MRFAALLSLVTFMLAGASGSPRVCTIRICINQCGADLASPDVRNPNSLNLLALELIAIGRSRMGLMAPEN